MRNSRAILMLLLSLVAGVAAVVLAGRWLNERATAPGAQIVVASRDVDLGQPLNAGMLQAIPWSSGSVPDGAFTDVKALEGRVPVTNLLRGEAVLDAKLAPVGTKGGLSAVIGQGKRAITVKVNEVIGVAGFALPGNYVDVLVSMQDDKDRPVSKIVLERILVLAVAQEAGRDETKPKVVNAVTLEVTPEQAERVDLSRSVGSLSLVLRNQVDRDAINTDGIRKAELLREPAAAPAPAAVATAKPTAPVKRTSAPRPPPVVAAATPAPTDDRARVEVIRGVSRSSSEL